MKRENWLLSILLAIGFSLHGQSFQSTVYGVKLESLEYLDNVCPPNESSGGMGFQGMDIIDPASAERIVDKMLSEMGITNKYSLRECKEIAKDNARAQAFFSDGRIKRYIIYDVDFLKEIANSSETNYAAMFVLAHEVGHHINDHTINYSGSEVPIEIEADIFAGTQLAKSGANLEQTLRAARSTENIFTGKYADHPGRMDRMRASFKGWMTYAKNDDTVLNENASYIKEYYDEINEYQRQLNEKNRPKPIVPKKEETEVVKNTSEPSNLPEAIPEKTKEEKEQQGAADVLQKYFKSLGGLAKVNSIKGMSFNELSNVEGFAQFDFHYDQKSPTLLVITNNTPGYEGEQFKISNDSLYHKLGDKKGWKLGPPPNTSESDEGFKKRMGSSTGNFLEDFTLFASPNLVALKEEIEFQGELCYRLEVKEVLEGTYLYRKGEEEHVYLKQNRYYRVSDGLLHAREDIRRIQYFKKKKPDGRSKERTITVHQDYKEVSALQFPTAYKIISSSFEGTEEFVDQTITKTVSDIEVVFEDKVQ